MEYYSAIKVNKFESVLVRWMKLECVIQCGVSQKEKKVLHINAYVWNLESDIDEPICKAGVETQM